MGRSSGLGRSLPKGRRLARCVNDAPSRPVPYHCAKRSRPSGLARLAADVEASTLKPDLLRWEEVVAVTCNGRSEIFVTFKEPVRQELAATSGLWRLAHWLSINITCGHRICSRA